MTVLRWRLCALQVIATPQQDCLSTDRIWTDDGKRRQRGEPHDVLNGIIDREKNASRVGFQIDCPERMVQVEHPKGGTLPD